MCYSEHFVTLLFTGRFRLYRKAVGALLMWGEIQGKAAKKQTSVFQDAASRLMFKNCKDSKSFRRNWRLYTCTGLIQLALEKKEGK